MDREGHLGASLLYFTPLAIALVYLNRINLLFVGYGIIFSTFMLPDYDMRIPFLSHRKISHSVFASVFIGIMFLAIAGGVYYYRPEMITSFYQHNPIELIMFVGLMGFLTMIFHILGDIYTPMGVPLLLPFNDKSYSLNLFRFDNIVANYLFLFAGILSLLGIIVLVIYTNGVVCETKSFYYPFPCI